MARSFESVSTALDRHRRLDELSLKAGARLAVVSWASAVRLFGVEEA
jgi:hypothetical protein